MEYIIKGLFEEKGKLIKNVSIIRNSPFDYYATILGNVLADFIDVLRAFFVQNFDAKQLQS
jgi:hypothetical protein